MAALELGPDQLVAGLAALVAYELAGVSLGTRLFAHLLALVLLVVLVEVVAGAQAVVAALELRAADLGAAALGTRELEV